MRALVVVTTCHAAALQKSWYWKAMPAQQQRMLLEWTAWSELRDRKEQHKAIGEPVLNQVYTAHDLNFNMRPAKQGAPIAEVV